MPKEYETNNTLFRVDGDWFAIVKPVSQAQIEATLDNSENDVLVPYQSRTDSLASFSS